jgi:hypothetical protein
MFLAVLREIEKKKIRRIPLDFPEF